MTLLWCISVTYLLDGCLPESTTVQGSTEIMWPEVGITGNASVECPCGMVSCTMTEYAYFSIFLYVGVTYYFHCYAFYR